MKQLKGFFDLEPEIPDFKEGGREKSKRVKSSRIRLSHNRKPRTRKPRRSR